MNGAYVHISPWISLKPKTIGLFSILDQIRDSPEQIFTMLIDRLFSYSIIKLYKEKCYLFSPSKVAKELFISTRFYNPLMWNSFSLITCILRLFSLLSKFISFVLKEHLQPTRQVQKQIQRKLRSGNWPWGQRSVI